MHSNVFNHNDLVHSTKAFLRPEHIKIHVKTSNWASVGAIPCEGSSTAVNSKPVCTHINRGSQHINIAMSEHADNRRWSGDKAEPRGGRYTLA